MAAKKKQSSTTNASRTKKASSTKKASGAKKAGVGAHGSRAKPKTGEGGGKWPSGGKKGEDE